jgi:hypothetical protein
MADAKGNGSMPVPINNHAMPPAPFWQSGPPGPSGAATEPPPCSPSGQPFMATSEPMTEPEQPPPVHLATNEEWGLLFTIEPDHIKFGPWPEPTEAAASSTAPLGQETPRKEIERLLQESGANGT